MVTLQPVKFNRYRVAEVGYTKNAQHSCHQATINVLLKYPVAIKGPLRPKHIRALESLEETNPYFFFSCDNIWYTFDLSCLPTETAISPVLMPPDLLPVSRISDLRSWITFVSQDTDRSDAFSSRNAPKRPGPMSGACYDRGHNFRLNYFVM